MHPIGRRIIVGGASGAGKTYVAEALAAKLGVRYVCNDEILHGPNWTLRDADERHAMFDEATRGEAWTIDGNLSDPKHPVDRLILQRADTLIWLDLPRRVVHWRVLKRTLRRCWTGEALWHGNRETFRHCFLDRDGIVYWSIKTYRRRKREYGAIFADPRWSHLSRIRLRKRREVAALLAGA